MTSLSAFLAPIAMLLPGPGPAADVSWDAALTPQEASAQQRAKLAGSGWLMIEAMEQVAINRQIRIERRITIRISPAAPGDARSLMADLPRGVIPANMVERKFGKCVPIGSISGVQPTQDNRLMLYLRDQRIISASLEKACSARDFYSGFYVEKNSDGMLCTGRDKLHSRTGANCEVDRMRQLVAR
ncbi:MAG: hypothetical protein WBH10_00810 [Allopontixanthobacter sediminis]